MPYPRRRTEWPSLRIRVSTRTVGDVTPCSPIRLTPEAKKSAQPSSAVGCSPDRRDVTGYDCTVTERAGDGVMPGPSDHLTDNQLPPDPVLSREPGHVDASLRDRMERLPLGHPSSPYN